MVVWSDRAISHITDFIDKAKAGTEQTAKNYMNKLIDYVEILETLPDLGKKFELKVSDYNVKQIIYRKHRIIYYKNEKKVVILAVLHTKLDIKKAIKDLNDGT